MTCSLCATTSPRLVLRDGLCGRCYRSQRRLEKSPEQRAEQTEYMRRWRARRGCKTVVHVAFDRNGGLLGVYTRPTLASPRAVSFQAIRLNKV